jgi:hypothetical protein
MLILACNNQHYQLKFARHTAPLDIDVILEIPQWTKTGTITEQILIDNVDCCMRELALHERQVFDHYESILRRKCIKHNINYRFRTFEEYQSGVLDLPLFEGSDGEYRIVLNDPEFSCKSEEAQFYMEKGRIPSKFAQQMRSRTHVCGYWRIDHKNKIVHLMYPSLNNNRIFSRFIYSLGNIHDDLPNKKIVIDGLQFDDWQLKQISSRTPWLKCDL